MAYESSIHGEPSPPHSNHEEQAVNEHEQSMVLTRVPMPPYTPPCTHTVQPYHYADPEEYEMSHPHEYYETPALYREGTYRTPPRPIGNTYMQTRSGRSIRTPMTASSPSSRMSRSPAPSRKKRKAKECSDQYQITQPLSMMTKDYDIPVADMMAWASRSSEARRGEVRTVHKGKIPRPMNSFMLYRRAYKERITKWGAQGDNNQLISKVAGQSWGLEPTELKQHYANIANIERDNHATAFPDYKFAPNKNTKKRDRDNDEDSDSDWESGSGYSMKRRRGHNDRSITRSRSVTPALVYGSPQYHPSSYQANNPTHLMPMPQYNQYDYSMQYSQLYGYEQGPYQRPISTMPYGPTSMPIQQEQYPADLIGLPPSSDGYMQGEGAGPEYAIDPGLGEYAAASSYQYGAYLEEAEQGIHSDQHRYGAEAEPAIYPGLQTLAPAGEMWSPTEHVGSAFDAELNRWDA